MARLTRVESFKGATAMKEYHGRLAYPPAIGSVLVFLRDDERRVITSTIVGLGLADDGQLLVETMNSRYRIAFLTRQQARQ